MFLAVALAFLINAGLGVYHAGVEWKYWAGPDTCAATPKALSTGTGGLLKQLEKIRVARCDEATWSFHRPLVCRVERGDLPTSVGGGGRFRDQGIAAPINLLQCCTRRRF